MFKVNNKDTRTTPLAAFWCLSCQIWTYFTPCSSVSIVNFEQANAGWVGITTIKNAPDHSFCFSLSGWSTIRNGTVTFCICPLSKISFFRWTRTSFSFIVPSRFFSSTLTNLKWSRMFAVSFTRLSLYLWTKSCPQLT